MKNILATFLLIFLVGCSLEIKHETRIDFTQEEVKQMGCLGGYKIINGKYVTPNVDELTPEMRKLYLQCMNSKG